MPDPLQLKVGNLVRFVSIPEEWARPGYHVPRDVIQFMKRMIRRKWPSRVQGLDDSGYPWIHAMIRQRGKRYWHTWLITESTGWRKVRRRITNAE